MSFNRSVRMSTLLILTMALGFHHATANAALGDPAGDELQVNTSTLADQENPTVAINAAGDFVVIWESLDVNTGDFGIYSQRYNADGTRQGGETQINTTILDDQSSPKIAMNGDGNSVVVWENTDQNGDINIYARRFSADGSPSGSNFRVNSVAISNATSGIVPAVGMDSAGNFTVAWESFDETNGDEDIYARRYDSSDTALGAEFRVNTEIGDDQMAPALAMNSAGDFIVAWQSAAQDADGSTGIYAQRYDATGTALGGEFRVNTTTANEQTAVTAAMNAAGDLVMTWESMVQDGNGKGIYAQRYDATGTPFGGEFRVNTETANAQTSPAVGINADLAMVVAWQSYGQDNIRHPSYGIHAQRYLGNTVTASSSNASSSSGGGGGGALGWWFSMMMILPALYGRRRRRVSY